MELESASEATDSFLLPPLDLLEPSVRDACTVDRDRLERLAHEVEASLKIFGVAGEIAEIHLGPLFTSFYVEMPPGSRLAQLRALKPDIARTLKAREVLIEPVAGRSGVNIMLFNDVRGAVPIRELIGSQSFEDASGPIPLVLGRTLLGDPACFDLHELQNLLVTGTTGSGKSVGLHSILLSLLYRLTPDRLRLILIDPKAVEFSTYSGIPHLLAPVLVDAERAVGALHWVVEQMDDRFRMMAAVGARNLMAFNARAERTVDRERERGTTVQVERDPLSGDPANAERHPGVLTLPAIVVIIDELADLMGTAFDAVDPLLQRIAQRGHIAGIHLILSTERPSVDILSGAVKANLSSRLSYHVVSARESLIALDEAGAEALLREGDMLLKVAGAGLTRIHGPNVGDGEIEAVAAHWRAQGPPEYVLESQLGGEESPPVDAAEMLYELAVSIVRETGDGSTSHLQRELCIRYNEAAHLIEVMERQGIVSPPDHLGRRIVYDRPAWPERCIDDAPRPRFRWPWAR